MQQQTSPLASASALLAHFAQRGVSLTVEDVREPDGSHWWRVWLRGGHRLTGDFAAINRVKPELVEILRAQGHVERSRLPLRRRHRPKSHTPIWNGPMIPPVYRGILAELRVPRR